jgi:hypothetical protein
MSESQTGRKNTQIHTQLKPSLGLEESAKQSLLGQASVIPSI